MINIPQLKMKNKKLNSIAVMTSGGDAPGMNAAIRAVVRYGLAQGCHVRAMFASSSSTITGRQRWPLAPTTFILAKRI